MNAIAAIGHNAPPTPYEGFQAHIDDLFAEAKNFLDGEPIANEGQAEAVANLLNRLRKTGNDADDARKVEKKPHDDAAKEVQARWKPLLDKVDLAASTCKQALSPWLAAKEAEQRRAAEAQQQEAERLAEAARQASQAPAEDLSAQAERRALEAHADSAAKAAKRASKVKAHAAGGERAIGLRTIYRAELTEPLAFGKWLWEHRQADYLEWLTEWAERECRHGPRGIPGITVHEERKAV